MKRIILASIVAVFLSAVSYAQVTSVDIIAKGTGTVRVSFNGGAAEFSVNSSTWKSRSSGIAVTNNTAYAATVTTTGSVDYTLQFRASDKNRLNNMAEILINGVPTAIMSEAEVNNLGGSFTITNRTEPRSLPFGDLDASRLEDSRLLTFGMGTDASGESGGLIVFNTLSLLHAKNQPYSIKFSEGPATLSFSENPSSINATALAGSLHVAKGLTSHTLTFRDPGNTVVATYVIAFSKTDHTVSPITSENSPHIYRPLRDGEVTVTRTIDGESKILELLTDWRRELVIVDTYAVDNFVVQYDQAEATLYPWRDLGSPREDCIHLVMEAHKADINPYVYYGWGGPPAGYMGWMYGSFKFTKYNIELISSTGQPGLKKRHEYPDFYVGNKHYYKGGSPSFVGPTSLLDGPDLVEEGEPGERIAVSGQRRVSTSPYTYESHNKTGGSSRRVIYTHNTSPTGYVNYSNLGSLPLCFQGQTKEIRESFGDGDASGSTALVKSFTYRSDPFEGKIVPSKVESKKGTNVLEKTEHEYFEPGDSGAKAPFAASGYSGTQDIVTVKTKNYPNSGSYLTTVTHSFSRGVDSLDLRGKTFSVERPDGSKTSYLYEGVNYVGGASQWAKSSSGNYLRSVSIEGKVGSSVSSYHGSNIDPITLEVSTHPDYKMGRSYATEKITDYRGMLVYEAMHVYTGSTFERFSHTFHDYDSWGRLVLSYDKTSTGSYNRTLYSAGYSGTEKDYEIDAQGIRIEYDYDSYGRISTSTKKGISGQADIVTTFKYDGAGRVRETAVGSGSNKLTSTASYDEAGRLVSRTDPGIANPTTISYYEKGTSGPGNSKVVKTHPNGGTEITEYFADGRMEKVYGTAVTDIDYTYTFLSDGKLETRSDFSTTQWVKNIEDWLGRHDRTQEPTHDGGSRYTYSFYNSKGQLYKQEFKNNNGVHLLPRKLYTYDSYGRLHREGSDSDMDGVLDTSTDHGVIRHFSRIQKHLTGANHWVLYEPTFIYPFENQSNLVAAQSVYT